MRFDEKKAALVISAGGGFKETGKGDGFEQITMDGMSMAMDHFIQAVKAGDAGKASKAMRAWSKLYAAYGDLRVPMAERTIKAGGSDGAG